MENEYKRIIPHDISGTTESLDGSVCESFKGKLLESPLGIINGSIIDRHGESDVTGELSECQLIFRRTIPLETTSEYREHRLKAVGNGEWEGYFERLGSETTEYGRISCVTGKPLPQESDLASF